MTQWIANGVTDQYVYFEAPPGLSSFTVYRSRNGAAAAAMTTPTVNETSAANMPGVYELLLDEDTTMAAGNTTESMALFISATGWAGAMIEVVLYDDLPANVVKVAGQGDLQTSGTGGQGIGT